MGWRTAGCDDLSPRAQSTLPRAHGQVWLIIRHALLWIMIWVQVDDEDTTHEDTTLTELREILAEHLIDDLTLVWAR